MANKHLHNGTTVKIVLIVALGNDGNIPLALMIYFNV